MAEPKGSALVMAFHLEAAGPSHRHAIIAARNPCRWGEANSPYHPRGMTGRHGTWGAADCFLRVRR